MSVAALLQVGSTKFEHSDYSVSSGLLQRKLSIGASNDPWEQEADRVADQVIAMPGRIEIGSAPLRIQRLSVQSVEQANVAPSSVEQTLAGPGRPLEPVLQRDMELRFGHDFSQVRVHLGTIAEKSAHDVNAAAFTVENDIVFGASNYVPRMHEGRRLIAHELAHVVQQSEMVGKPAMLLRFRYGHSNECIDKTHLAPFIWPGHDHAKKIVVRAIAELNKSKMDAGAKLQLTRLFGPGADTRKSKIKDNFAKIGAALEEGYMYHCAESCEKPHNVARAWTEPSGRRDITICFDKVRSFSIPAIAWIIVHENVHRGMNIWPNPHPWQPTDFENCLGFHGTSPQFTTVVLDNPDSYACFASYMWFLP